jgi:hypothetical protein
MPIVSSLSRTIITNLFRDFLSTHTVTSLSEELSKNRVGIWRELKNLQTKKIVRLSSVGAGKTNAYIVSLNWGNPLTEKLLDIYLMEDASREEKYKLEFRKVENATNFLIINETGLKKDKSMELINVVSDKNKFIKIQSPSDKDDEQTKKITAVNFTERQFLDEIKKPNQGILKAIKSGVVLFGQEKFVDFMKDLHFKVSRTP